MTLPIISTQTVFDESLAIMRPAWCQNAKSRRRHRSTQRFKSNGRNYSGIKYDSSDVELAVGDNLFYEGVGNPPFIVEGRTNNNHVVLSRQTKNGPALYKVPFDGIVNQSAVEMFHIPIDLVYTDQAVVDGKMHDNRYLVQYQGDTFTTTRNLSDEALYEGEQPLDGTVRLSFRKNIGMAIRGGVDMTPCVACNA